MSQNREHSKPLLYLGACLSSEDKDTMTTTLKDKYGYNTLDLQSFWNQTLILKTQANARSM
tara:strand:- start:19352 stop:19534 length:183 start_codon:yes stop_codon:yes gene_type:complete